MVWIFVPYRRPDEWSEALFPDWSLARLPMAGVPFVEHQLGRAAEEGATRVLVLDYAYDPLLAYHLTGGGRRRWPFELDYRGGAIFASEEDVRRRHAAFLRGEACRVVMGPLLPYGGAWLPVESLREYFDLNFRLLADPKGGTTAGYSREKGVALGMDVVIKTGFPIVGPVCLCDSARVEYACQLKGRVIVGTRSIVDVGTELEDTIVFPHTYVGRRLDLKGKIVAGARIVDVDTGVYVDIEEEGIVGEAADHSGTTPTEALLALFLILLFAPAYLLWLPFKPFLGRRLWAYKLSQDRYPKLFGVLVGRALLVRLGPGKLPAVFRASEAIPSGLPPDAHQETIEDRYYAYNRTPRMTLGVVFKALVNRLFTRADEPRI